MLFTVSGYLLLQTYRNPTEEKKEYWSDNSCTQKNKSHPCVGNTWTMGASSTAGRIRASMSRAREMLEEREFHLYQDRVSPSTSRARETSQEWELCLEQVWRRTEESRIVSRHSDLKLGGFNYSAGYDYYTHPKVVIGRMDVVCNHCQAKKYKGEPPGMCCSNGKVKLPPLKVPPEPLLSYLSGSTADSKHFLKNVRAYNSSFQMTSFGASSICLLYTSRCV